MVKFVENELQNIQREVKEMWKLVYQQLDNAYNAVLNADQELADKVIIRRELSAQHGDDQGGPRDSERR